MRKRTKKWIEYANKYNEIHYKQFATKIKKEEYEKLENTLKSIGMTKSDFIRFGLKELTGDSNE